MKTLRLIFFAGIIIISGRLHAQARLGITIDSFPTQLILTDTTTHYGYFAVHNFGADTFNGSFSLNYQIDSATYNSNTDSGLYYPSTLLIIPPGDSSSLQQLAIHASGPNGEAFSVIGSSGVVIWPVSQSAFTYDSATVVVEVTFPAGVAPVSSPNLQLYINQQQLFINTDDRNLLKRVRIYDIEGQLLLEQDLSSSTVISMARYASGCYMAVVTLSDDSRRVFKIMNVGNR